MRKLTPWLALHYPDFRPIAMKLNVNVVMQSFWYSRGDVEGRGSYVELPQLNVVEQAPLQVSPSP